MLFLSESVRDVIDIKLSKKYNAPTNVLGDNVKVSQICSILYSNSDTPCTAAAHLATRDKELWKVWFGDRHGCAEPPRRGQIPNVLSVPKLKVSFTCTG